MSSISKELKKRIELLEKEQQRQQEDVNKLTEIVEVPITTKRPAKVSRESYIIRLVFSNNAPISEWSDETHGWRTAGLGSQYSNQQLAEQKLAALKKKWPTYPLEISLVRR